MDGILPGAYSTRSRENLTVRSDTTEVTACMHATEAQSLKLRMLRDYYSGKSICNLLLKFAMQLIFLNDTHNDMIF